jgi:F-type H+-transporting ATPase subunit b
MQELANQLADPFFAISSDIAFNATLVIQLFVFLTAFFALRTLLWKPFLAVLDQRRSLTEGNREQAATEEAEVLRLEADYLEKVRAARQAAAEERNTVRADGEAKARATLEAARVEAQGISDTLRSDVAKAAEAARGSLRGQADEIATLMSNKLLGRTV